jgi:hypothetical protein
MFQGRATPWRAKSALSNYYNSQTFSYFGPLEPTLDLRLLQPPDLHHFLGNCPGRSQKFVAPHSEHAYFGTSNSLLRPDSHIPDTQPIRFRAAEKASVAISLGVPMLPRGIGDTK